MAEPAPKLGIRQRPVKRPCQVCGAEAAVWGGKCSCPLPAGSSHACAVQANLPGMIACPCPCHRSQSIQLCADHFDFKTGEAKGG